MWLKSASKPATEEGARPGASAAHEALAENYRQKLKTRQDLPADDLTGIFSDQSQLDRFLRLAEQLESAIQSNVFYPNPNYTCPSCSCAAMCRRGGGSAGARALQADP